MSSAKWRPFCLGLNVLKARSWSCWSNWFSFHRFQKCVIRWVESVWHKHKSELVCKMISSSVGMFYFQLLNSFVRQHPCNTICGPVYLVFNLDSLVDWAIRGSFCRMLMSFVVFEACYKNVLMCSSLWIAEDISNASKITKYHNDQINLSTLVMRLLRSFWHKISETFSQTIQWCWTVTRYRTQTLQWRHNERVGVSNHQPRDCLLNRLCKAQIKKTSKLRVTGFCAGNSPVTGEIPAQRASNAENVSIWRRHHEYEKKLPTSGAPFTNMN